MKEISNLENDEKIFDVSNESAKNEISYNEKGEVVSLDIYDKFVKDLYNYVPNINEHDELISYQSQKVTERDLSNGLKLLTAFSNLDAKDVTRIEPPHMYADQEHYIYSKDVIEKKCKEIFGDNVAIHHESIDHLLAYEIIYQNDEYDSFYRDGGGDYPWSKSTHTLISAEKYDDETICIYDKYAHIIEPDIYSSSDKKKKFASDVDFYENDLFDFDGGTTIERIEKYLGKELPTYKHTFRKNANGEYYWYSTEPIKMKV